MSHFDEALWKKRAWDRHTKAIRSKKDTSKSTAKWATEVRAIYGLRVVVEWASARGLEVVFESTKCGGYYSSGAKKICVSHRARPDRQLCVLLHECGHYLVEKSGAKDRFTMGYRSAAPISGSTLHHRLDILDEEFEAWYRGWKLARKLNAIAEIDKPMFDAIRNDYLNTHVKSAAGIW